MACVEVCVSVHTDNRHPPPGAMGCSRLETCSNLFTCGPPTAADIWLLRRVSILLECFLVTARKWSLGQGNVFYTCVSFSSQGGGVSLDRDPLPPFTVISGQYASYWNAFLLKIVLTHDVDDAAVHARFGQEGERAVVFIIRSSIYAPDVLVNSAIIWKRNWYCGEFLPSAT